MTRITLAETRVGALRPRKTAFDMRDAELTGFGMRHVRLHDLRHTHASVALRRGETVSGPARGNIAGIYRLGQPRAQPRGPSPAVRRKGPCLAAPRPSYPPSVRNRSIALPPGKSGAGSTRPAGPPQASGRFDRLRRAPEPHHADERPAPHPTDRRLLAEDRKPRAQRRAPFRARQFLPLAHEPERRDAGDGRRGGEGAAGDRGHRADHRGRDAETRPARAVQEASQKFKPAHYPNSWVVWELELYRYGNEEFRSGSEQQYSRVVSEKESYLYSNEVA